ncbi:hypothetical protein MPSEU_000571000 [Mayamaea pseudoterrestris]|nr:hypothetical protein MPSEU_000571000 [Mayamaea pseudoterrestris]
MDFTIAAKRLARDQSNQNRSRRPVELSAQAKREAESRRNQQTAMTAQREQDKRQAEYMRKYVLRNEMKLGSRYLSSLTPTSIYGHGDKIAMPPSVLEQLTMADNSSSASSSDSTPWTFRVGICDPNYTFPASPAMKALKMLDDDGHLDDDSDDDEMSEAAFAFLDELDYKYLAYTHATVVEFTQEEGRVGLPEPIAIALLKMANHTQQQEQRQNRPSIPTFRTVDSAAATLDKAEVQQQLIDTGLEDAIDGDEKTPGHLAWGAFDLPNMPIEITLVKLPKGRGVMLVPTHKAIRNGFYHLDDVKLVLEQSLVRTRATLTVGDTVAGWHRGLKFELNVSAVRPSTYRAVLSLNTDLEVEFGSTGSSSNSDDTNDEQRGGLSADAAAGAGAGGRTLNDASRHDNAQSAATIAYGTAHNDYNVQLLPEPPADAANVCHVQIRGAEGINGRRRFDLTTSTLSDLFAFACTITNEPCFQLVTRYPRRVLSLSAENAGQTLIETGISSGQELFMIERLSVA